MKKMSKIGSCSTYDFQSASFPFYVKINGGTLDIIEIGLIEICERKKERGKERKKD
jgi:hypothetical protein